jgi:hypothetical protein
MMVGPCEGSFSIVNALKRLKRNPWTMDFIYEPKMENSGCFDVYELDWKLKLFCEYKLVFKDD